MFVQLFISFFKIGLFTFGGGYAMLPLIEKELVDKKKWITSEELLEMFTISQMTPGTIAINASTFIGNKKAGKLGGIIASLGVIVPSFIIITLIYKFVGESFQNPIVHSVFSGIKACIIGLIASSVLKICRTSFISGVSYILFILAFLALLIFKLNPIFLIIIGALFASFVTFKFPNKVIDILEVK